METERRKAVVTAALIFAGAAIVHGLLVFVFLPPAQLVKYPLAATQYIKGELRGERLLDFSPLYLQVHVAAHRISSNPASLVSYFHIFCSSISAVLFFLLLQRFFRYWIALPGAIAFVLDRGLIAYIKTFEPEPLMLLLMLVFGYMITSKRASGVLIAGISLGLAVLTRPNFLPVLFLMPVYFYFNFEPGKKFKKMLLFSLPVLACLGGLWVRNTLALGYFSPLVMNPGTALFEGNNPNSWGFSSIYPPVVDELARQNTSEADYQHVAYRLIARKAMGRNLTLPEINRYWTMLAVHYLTDHPAVGLKLLSLKVFHFFHSYQWHDVSGAFWNENWLDEHFFPSIPFSLISALGLIGLILMIPRWREFAPYYAVFITQFLFMMVIYVSARQRVSILWVFMFFACGALQYFSEKRKTPLLMVLAATLALALYLKTSLMVEESRLWLHIRISNAANAEAYRYRSKDQLLAATAYAAKALANAPFFIDRRPANLSFEPEGYSAKAATLLQPVDASTQFDRAVLWIQSSRPEDAYADLKGVLHSGVSFKRDFYQSSNPLYFVACAALLKQDKPAAMDALHRAEAQSPGDPWVLSLLYVLSNDQSYSEKLIRYFGEMDGHMFIGSAAILANSGEIAAPNIEYVCGNLPEFRRCRLYFAAALGMNEKYEDGVAQYRAAMGMREDPVMLEDQSIALFEGWSESQQGNSYALYSYGVVLRQFGHYQEALQVQKRAEALQSSEAIQKEIVSLQRALNLMNAGGSR